MSCYCLWSHGGLQYIAQFPYTSVCNRYIFSSVKRKFLKFLSEIAYLLTFNMYKDWLLDQCIFKIMAFFSKLLSCPVFVQLTKFPYIRQNTIKFFRENTRSKLMCQPPCCLLIVFSLHFVKRNRLSGQCLTMCKANGYSDGRGTGCASSSFQRCTISIY